MSSRAAAAARRLACLLAVGLFSAALAADPPAPGRATPPATGPATQPPAVTVSPPAAAPVSRPAPGSVTTQPYRWRLANDAAGGNCTGLYFHPADAAIRYVQSGDTGGYRWDHDGQRWVSFTDWNPDPAYGYMTGVALDPRDRNLVYYAAGHPDGEVFKSVDRGQTFAAAKLRKPDGRPVYVNGGEDAATGGDQLVVDPNNPSVLYLVSRLDGLWCSTQGSAPDSWKRIGTFAARGDVVATLDRDGKPARKPGARGGLSLVAVDPAGGTVEADGVSRSRVIYVGVVGDRRAQPGGNGAPVERTREGGIWRSADGGQTWALLGGPVDFDAEPARAYVAAGGTLYATVSGRVVKATRDAPALTDLNAPKGRTGYFALAVDPADADHVVVARYGVAPREASYGDENRMFRTIDGGRTWAPMSARFDPPPWWGWFASYAHFLRFEPNAPRDEKGRTKSLWLGDWIGPWLRTDLDADQSHWKLISRGRGGTVVTGIACPPPPPPGDPGRPVPPIAPVLMTGANFDGFRYLNFTAVPLRRLTQAAVTQAPGRGDGLADGTGVAYCEADPKFVAAVGGWDRGHNGGGGASADNGVTWTPFAQKGLAHPGFGPSPKLGRIAVGATKQPNGFPVLVWVPQRAGPRYSLDWGKTWAEGTGAPAGAVPGEWDPWQVLAADPIDGRTFYLFGDNLDGSGAGKVFVTTDGGATWSAAGRVEYASAKQRQTEHHLRACPGHQGDLWLSLNDSHSSSNHERTRGFYRSTDAGRTWTKLAGWQRVTGFAFGAPAVGGPAATRPAASKPAARDPAASAPATGAAAADRRHPSLVVAGTLNGRAGIFVSDDATSLSGDLAGATWRQVWDHASSDATSIVHCLANVGADRQSYGRIYVGSTGTGRGMFYGEPATAAAPAAVTNVTVAPEVGQVVIEWTDPVGAAVYDVQRAAAERAGRPEHPATGGGGGGAGRGGGGGASEPPAWQTVSSGGWQARVVDPHPAAGQRYVYRVTAANALGRSEPAASPPVVAFTRIEPAKRFGTAHNGAGSVEMAFDANPSTAFDAASADDGHVGFDAGRPVVATRLRYAPRPGNGRRMVGGRFEAAEDPAGPWTALHTVTGEPPTGRRTDVLLPGNGTPLRYYRYVGPPGGHCNIAEMEVLEGGR